MSKQQPRVMIFHAPFEIREGAATASQLRPAKMRANFQKLGYRVIDLSGIPRQRKRKIKKLKKLLRAGLKIDFCYSESATTPNAVASPESRIPPHPFLDAGLFYLLRRYSVPVGVFYRDIYWRFPEYRTEIPKLLDFGLKLLYYWDLWNYRFAGLRIYLPSEPMIAHIPVVAHDLCSPLPPGGELVDSPSPEDQSALFVGGIGPNYQLHETVSAYKDLDDFSFTMCVPKNLWEKVSSEYEPVPPNFNLVHGTGKVLEKFYSQAQLGMLLTKPIPYWEFAVPVKLYEYICHGKPVIAARGSLTGKLVENMGVGWTIDYSSAALKELLTKLRDNPDLIDAKQRQVFHVQSDCTWEARARQVVKDLSAV